MNHLNTVMFFFSFCIIPGVATLLSDAASSVAVRIDPDSVAVATAASAEGATRVVRPSSSGAAGCRN